MEWFTHNPIADMYGPHFLVFYAAVIVITLVSCRWAAGRADSSDEMLSLPIHSQPDPFEIAFLRGNLAGLIEVVILSLIDKGYLRVNPRDRGWLERRPLQSGTPALSDLERRVYDQIVGSVKISELRKILAEPLRPLMTVHESRFEREELVLSKEVRDKVGLICLLAGTVILGLGGYKLAVALSRGHRNVFFLILLGSVGFIGTCLLLRARRLSKRGKDYLARLQSVFKRLKESPPAGGNFANTDLLMGVGLFGVGLLAGTMFTDYAEAMKPLTLSGSDSGGGCSGSGCSGGGCGGGGCGGCGGGD